MNKQAFYAILTFLLIPLGICLIILKMTVPSSGPKHSPVQIATDRIAYQQLAKAIVADDGRVTVLDGKLATPQQLKQFKGTEVVLTDNHASPLLTQRQKLHLRSKILVASDSFQGPDANNYWLSPQVILQTISRLSDLLSDLDPQNRDFYIRQSQQLLAQTQPLADGIARLQAEKNVQYLATNHAQQVFMTQLGYQPVQQDLASATAADFDTLAKKMQDHTIRFVLTASQDQSDHDQRVMQLATQYQVPIITFNQVLPAGEKVWDWQLNFVNQLQAALKPVEGGK
ncbi:3-phosphoglycerate kinase [Leuconostoc lactis]|uniref:metal ABC transporter solute-binding protein, Zn/Mn family n=1 Tax=Leuconostoc lactis TaxID=1246 RepID=UPI0011BBE5B6|nr:zinc ABC transporter substrate-binding protein [Leuconostoc lactis]QEA46920.1 3-phosphoglycerate kinase [Leuconostoc lactis]